MNRLESLEQCDYVRDILAQPEAVERTLALLEQLRLPEDLAAGPRAGRIRRVVLTGMGASFHALYPVHLRLGSCGVASQIVETSELVHYQAALLEPDTLVVAVSQSGRSAEILRLLEATAGRVTLVGISNSPDSPLAEHCAFTLTTQAGKESSVSTKTYVATLAALEWLGAALTGVNTNDALASVATAISPMREYLSRWNEHVELLVRWLSPVRHIFLCGRGPSLATAWEGALVLKEAAHFPAEGMGSAEFRHGPLDMVEPGILVCIFAGENRTRELNQRLATDVNEAGGMSAWIGPESGLQACRIPELPGLARLLVEILPVQMMSLALAVRSGREPGRFTRLSKVTAIE